MIRANEGHDVVLGSVKYVEYSGLSTDQKPTYFGKEVAVVNGERVEKTIGLATGSVFLEVDTGDVYLFDETETEWYKVGGSSSSGNAGVR